MATACKQSLRAGMDRTSAGRACAHDGHAWACRTHAMNMYGFVDVDFVDVDAAGNLRAWCMDMGKSGIATVCHCAFKFAMEACRTPCHSVSRKSFSVT